MMASPRLFTFMGTFNLIFINRSLLVQFPCSGLFDYNHNITMTFILFSSLLSSYSIDTPRALFGLNKRHRAGSERLSERDSMVRVRAEAETVWAHRGGGGGLSSLTGHSG